jgi:VanZ family protein
MLLISSLSSTPDFGQVFPGFDKVLHILLYFVFGITIQIMFIGNFPKKSAFFNIMLSILFGLAFGAADELFQSFQPLRSSDIKDFLADFTGIVLSNVWHFYLVKKIVKKS